MSTFAADNFNRADGALATASAASDGGSWSKHPAVGAGTGDFVTKTGRVYANATNDCLLHSGIPASANYDVAATLHVMGTQYGQQQGPVGRASPTADTMYQVVYSDSNGTLGLWKKVAGTGTLLGSATVAAPATPTDFPCTLSITDAAKRVLWGGVESVTSPDNSITAAGRAGIRANSASAATYGVHFEDFSATGTGGTAGTPLALTGLSEGSGVTAASPTLAVVLSGSSPGSSASLAAALAALLSLSGTSTGAGADTILSGAIPHALSGTSAGSGDTSLVGLLLATRMHAASSGIGADTVSSVIQPLALSAASNGHSGDLVRLINGLPVGANEEFLGLLLWSLWLKYLEEWYRTT